MLGNDREVLQPRERLDRDSEKKGTRSRRDIDNRRGVVQVCNDVTEHAHTGVLGSDSGRRKGDARGAGEGGQWHFVN